MERKERRDRDQSTEAPARRRSSKASITKERKPSGRPRRDGVDALQQRAVLALLDHPTQKAAAAAIGVSERTITRWLEEKPFRDAYFQRLDELLADQWSAMTAPRHEIWARFMALTQSDNEAIALRAVTWYFDHLVRLRPLLTWRPAEEVGVAVPARLRELYEELEDQPDDNGDGAA